MTTFRDHLDGLPVDSAALMARARTRAVLDGRSVESAVTGFFHAYYDIAMIRLRAVIDAVDPEPDDEENDDDGEQDDTPDLVPAEKPECEPVEATI